MAELEKNLANLKDSEKKLLNLLNISQNQNTMVNGGNNSSGEIPTIFSNTLETVQSPIFEVKLET